MTKAKMLEFMWRGRHITIMFRFVCFKLGWDVVKENYGNECQR